MRLWHFKLLPYLPKSQLLAQWRELNSIFKKQDKHILINYVYEYPRKHIGIYATLVIHEIFSRGYKIRNFENYEKYLKDDAFYIWEINDFYPFPQHHTDRYLLQCFYNLQEKYDRGQSDFSEEDYNKLEGFIRDYLEEKK